MPLYLLPMEIDRDRHAGGDFLSDGRQPANVTPGRLTREDDGAIDSECAGSDRQVDALAAEIDPFVLDERAGLYASFSAGGTWTDPKSSETAVVNIRCVSGL